MSLASSAPIPIQTPRGRQPRQSRKKNAAGDVSATSAAPTTTTFLCPRKTQALKDSGELWKYKANALRVGDVIESLYKGVWSRAKILEIKSENVISPYRIKYLIEPKIQYWTNLRTPGDISVWCDCCFPYTATVMMRIPDAIVQGTWDEDDSETLSE